MKGKCVYKCVNYAHLINKQVLRIRDFTKISDGVRVSSKLSVNTKEK